MPDGDTPGEAVIEDQLRQARQALADADGARDAQLSDALVINRLYYACFHAAQAVLYHRGTIPLATEVCSPSSGPKLSSLVTRHVRMAVF